MRRATNSLPVPLSPVMRMVLLVGATARADSNTERRARLWPTMLSRANSRATRR